MGKWGDMAVRGVFAIQRHKVDSSLNSGLSNAPSCAKRNFKSLRRRSAVYTAESSAPFAGKASRIGIQCLDATRISATLGVERLAKQVAAG
jgi:hypothetical protein